MTTMNLADIIVPQEQVAIPGTKQSFGVGALSFTDIVALFVNHREIAADLYLRFQNHGQKPDNKKVVTAALGTMINEAPDMVAAIISLASSGGFEGTDKVKTFSFTVQTEALQKIATLTFGRLEDGAVKKFFETVASALEVFNQTAQEVTQTSLPGSDKSDAM